MYKKKTKQKIKIYLVNFPKPNKNIRLSTKKKLRDSLNTVTGSVVQ